jgi:hypothetical protein
MLGRGWRGRRCLSGGAAVALTILVAASVGGASLAATTSTRAVARSQQVTLVGHVLAGGVPIARAGVRLFAGGARRATLLGSATSAPNGTFTIAYRPPTGRRTPLYVVSDGGRRIDRRVELMSVAGPAGARPTSVYVDEQSTVAGAYALARFLHGDQAIGPAPGLPNAAATAANLYESRAGKVSFVLATPPNGNATEALATFNALANALASCTTGGAADCTRLLGDARPPGLARPANTLDALVDIARNSAEHTRQLFALSRKITGRAAAGPALSRRPGSWILGLAYVGAGLNAPGRMAFDAQGNIWANNNSRRLAPPPDWT